MTRSFGQRGTRPAPDDAGSRPLDGGARSGLERHFGRGFGDVRVHDDEPAHEEARRLGARAFTVGSDLYFGRGAYSPGTPGGMALLAHELAHVLQQRGGEAAGRRTSTTIPARASGRGSAASRGGGTRR